MELPIAFENRMKTLLGVEFDTFSAALQENPVKGLRINTHKISVETFVQNAPFALTPISYVTGGFIVSEDAQAGKHPYHHAGAYYMQDPGAMATVAALPEEILKQPNLRVLDLCAAPGGKTTQLAAACAPNGGTVLANEYVTARSRILAGNVERMGLDNVCVTNVDTKYIALWYPDFFDLVVVDAPCSGEGMFRKNDVAITEWSEETVAMCAERQQEILSNAAKAVASGGYLLYSTCTYATEENEETVAKFLDENPSFSLIPCSPAVVENTADGIDVTSGKHPELTRCRRFYPHVSQGEGQFVALLHRAGDAVRSDKPEAFVPLPKSLLSAAEAFLMETMGHTLSPLLLRHGYISVFSALESVHFPLPPQSVAVGVPIGEERKGRIVPHHHFFMSYGTECLSKIILAPDDARLARYLAGEEIDVPTDCNGYTAVLVRIGDSAVSIGGGKAVCGRLKNYYPKGLRVKI
ncbi:MAG: RNA methyltransferase [Clostridia bacterium]|nr:RNA methyltransferase [Clostridia bacterium]